MKKVLVLTTTYPRWVGDTEPAFIHNLCIELSKSYEVSVIAPHTIKAKKHENIEGITVTRFRYFFPLRFQNLTYEGGVVPKIKNNPFLIFQVPFLCLGMLIATMVYLRRHPVDAIHAHWIIPQGLIALLSLKLTGKSVPLLVTSHGADLYSMNSSLLIKLKKWILKKATIITVVSRAMQKYCEEELKIKRQVLVQSMGINTREKFVDVTPFDQRKGIVYVGRLVEKKGVDLLIDALASLGPEYDYLELNVVGDGTAKEKLISRCKELGIDDRVKFVGAVDANSVAQYLNDAQICVMPSRVAESGDQEGLGLVAGEALACGCICIVSDLPAIQDVHDCKELQFEAGNASALASRLKFTLANEKVTRDLSLTLKQKVLSRFDWRHVGEAYVDIISKSISEHAERKN